MKHRTFSRPGPLAAGLLALAAVLLLPPALLQAAGPTVNGDTNGDGSIDIADAVHLLGWLFLGGAEPEALRCPPGAQGSLVNGDSNGDRTRDLSDAVHLLAWLFTGGPEPAAFRCTGGSRTVRFAVLGDTGKGNQTQHAVAAALKARCESAGCDFIQLLGSNIFDDGVDSVDDPQWQTKFEVPYGSIDLPFYAILGNHDYGGGGAGFEFDKAEHQVAYGAVSSRFEMPARYYRRTVEHVELFALDTNEQLFLRDAAQREEVEGWIAASTAGWRIAFGHHPYLSNGPHGNAGSYEDQPFIPIVNGKGVEEFFEGVLCGQVDVYFSAHDRSLQWLEPTCQGTELIVSGTGSVATELRDRNPARFQALEPGFVYVKIVDDTLTAEFIDAAGEVLYSRTITRPGR